MLKSSGFLLFFNGKMMRSSMILISFAKYLLIRLFMDTFNS